MLLACLYLLCIFILDDMESSSKLSPSYFMKQLKYKLLLCIKKSHNNPYSGYVISNYVYMRGPNRAPKVFKLPSFQKLELGQQHAETHQ